MVRNLIAHFDTCSSHTQTELANLDLEDEPRPLGAFQAFDSEPPRAPELESNHFVAMNITEQFINAAERWSTQMLLDHVLISPELDVGQLIKDTGFTLFSAVGALEVSSQCLAFYQNLNVLDHGSQDG